MPSFSQFERFSYGNSNFWYLDTALSTTLEEVMSTLRIEPRKTGDRRRLIGAELDGEALLAR